MRANLWAAVFEGRTYAAVASAVEAAQWARDLDCLVAHPPMFKPHVAAMLAVKPSLVLACYANNVLLDTTQADVAALPEDAFAHDAAGNRVWTTDHGAIHVLNPRSETAITFKVLDTVRRMRESGYPDLYLDVAGTGPLTSYGSSKPIDPRTGIAWTVTDWLSAIAVIQDRVVKAVTAALGRPVRLILNSLNSGPVYWTSTKSTLRAGVHASVCEGWLRSSSTASAATHPNETAWRQNVDLIVDAEKRGFAVLAMTKVWSSPAATPAQQDAWETFAVASFLLATNGASRLEVSFARGDAMAASPAQMLDLGDPLGPYMVEAPGLYVRNFTGGRVRVNPTALVKTGTDGNPLAGFSGEITVAPPPPPPPPPPVDPVAAALALLEAADVDTDGGLVEAVQDAVDQLEAARDGWEVAAGDLALAEVALRQAKENLAVAQAERDSVQSWLAACRRAVDALTAENDGHERFLGDVRAQIDGYLAGS